MRAVIVDDDPIFRSIAANLLSAHGFAQVDEFELASSAIAAVRTNSPEINLFLLDLNMPNIDGFSVIGGLAKAGYNGALFIVSGEKEGLINSAKTIASRQGLKNIHGLSKPITEAAVLEMVEKARENSLSDGGLETFSIDINASDNEIELFYQPQFDCLSQKVVGAEALLRIKAPDGNVLGPKAFLDRHEQIDDRVSLTKFLFETMCRDLAKAKSLGLAFEFGFNIDAVVFEELSLVGAFADATQRFGIDPANIKIELTESRLPNNQAQLLEVMARLSMRGFQLSIDDFGVGASNYALLREAPFDEIKLDKDIMQAAMSDNAARYFLESTRDIANELDIRFVAEGVEDRHSVDFLCDLNVPIMQGFFFSRPVQLMQLTSLIETLPKKLSVAA